MTTDTELLAWIAAADADAHPAPPIDTRALAQATRDALAGTEPVVLTVIRFKCPFCRFSNSRRKTTVEHIARCWHNPAVCACKTCTHFHQEAPEPEVGLRGMEWCDAQDLELDAVRHDCPLWALRGEAS